MNNGAKLSPIINYHAFNISTPPNKDGVGYLQFGIIQLI